MFAKTRFVLNVVLRLLVMQVEQDLLLTRMRNVLKKSDPEYIEFFIVKNALKVFQKHSFNKRSRFNKIRYYQKRTEIYSVLFAVIIYKSNSDPMRGRRGIGGSTAYSRL